MNHPKTVSVLGLGRMGSRVAAQLARKGFALRVYNRTPEKADALRPLRVCVASSPAEAASESDPAIYMLSDDVASREVCSEKMVQSTPHARLSPYRIRNPKRHLDSRTLRCRSTTAEQTPRRSCFRQRPLRLSSMHLTPG